MKYTMDWFLMPLCSLSVRVLSSLPQFPTSMIPTTAAKSIRSSATSSVSSKITGSYRLFCSLRLLQRVPTKLPDAFTDKCPPPKYDTGCTFCHVSLPEDKPINYEHNLNGTAAVPWKHVLVLLHGVEDFDEMASKINMIPGSLAQDFEVIKRKMLSPMHPVTLSNALICGQSLGGERHRVRIYPDNLEVEFEPRHLEAFVQRYLVPEVIEEAYNPFKTSGKKEVSQVSGLKAAENETFFVERPVKKDLVLICGHTKRDVRCGLLAPPLEAEFQRVLQTEQLSVDVGRISHIGGHVYAGNVIYFPLDARKPVWYGRVFPPNVQGIVSETIQNGRIIKELYRGQV